ncbi:alpha/beta fold hydrolase [Streptomyces sp. ODS28]|uniref:esterase/lipase family protein n=1 Tax=Streptomyces sp. ODS28 TaxID=3136688 RepID=UPI0031E58BA0
MQRSGKRARSVLVTVVSAGVVLTAAPAAPAGAEPVPTGSAKTVKSAKTALPAKVVKAAPGKGGWNDYSCRPSAAHPRPVVLVHGTGGNSVDNWLGLAPYLVKRGYCVFSLDYGQWRGIPLIHGLGPVEKSAGQLDAFVDKVLAATGAPKADLVGHSQGGMMPRYYLKYLGGAAHVNTLVGIAPSNHGSTLSGLGKLADKYPPIGDAVRGFAPAAMQQRKGSAFLQRLNEGGDTVPGVKYTVIATKYDEVVTPYKSQFLHGPDVKNVLLQDLCPANISEHLAIGLADRMAFHETANALDPANARPTTCSS